MSVAIGQKALFVGTDTIVIEMVNSKDEITKMRLCDVPNVGGNLMSAR